jgi:hypothetical protein
MFFYDIHPVVSVLVVLDKYFDIYIYITAIGLTHGGSSTAHIYTQTVNTIH